ncbi:cytochrome P450 monooxygenase-like protein 5 [Elsinoe australis]|uniref:Cytochrome P450 monooxygenase-like protein 5 n=1 Tax=Elsinoe australis TaxID=40998 RepID=A0A4U7B657_9PEZI|nr:cytochrome P450 monooxygenase-like protein 5 [Elsinoe australis]
MPDLHTKYGKVVRTAPNEVSISDVSAIREIYGPGSKYCKSDWYSVWQGTQKTDLFAERDIATHANLKKNISRVYAMSSLTAMEKYVDDAVDFFMTCMAERSNQAIDLGVWLQLLAFDVIGEVSFSKRFGFLETGDDGTLSKIERALRSLAWVGQMPWVYWLEHHLAPIFGHHLDVKLRHGSIRSYAAKEVEARRGRQSEHDDILSHLFKVSAEGKIDDHAVTSIATANIFAGSDTTAISLRAIVYSLIRNPDCLRRLREELQERKIDGRLQFPAKFSQVSDWPYLQACISEALRLHPAVGMALPRVVPENGRTLAGVFLPEGTVVGMNAWVIHRDPAIWGKDVDAFRPERWLTGNKGDMERCFLAFGGGARLCIGKNISLMEMSKLIPLLFDRFDIEMENPDQGLTESCAWFVKQEGLVVRMRPKKY